MKLKTKWSLLPWNALEVVTNVLQTGNEKDNRKEDDWQQIEQPKDYFLNKAMRHLVKEMSTEECDDSGHPHWAHAIADLLMYGWHWLKDVSGDGEASTQP